MFKFLRRYNKWILAVGGTLLLIVFLIPQAISGLSQRAAVRSENRAVIGGDEEVPMKEWSQIQEQTQFLVRLGAGLPSVGRIDSPEHWYLLVREADDAGVVGTNATVVAAPELVNQMAANVGKQPAFVYDIEAKMNGVSKLVALYHGAGKLSDRRLRHVARRLFHAANVELVMLQADADSSDLDPTEEQITAHLEQFADVAPGEGERGFGYLLPDRVKIEWLTIPADTVRAMVEASDDLNGVALRRHWKRYEQSRAFPAIEDGAAIPDVVRNDMLESLTAEKLDEIAKYGSQQLANRRRGVPELDGYLVLPDDWADQRMLLADLAAQLQERYSIETPIYRSMGDEWLSARDLVELDELAGATTDKFGDPPVGIVELASALNEFGGDTRMLVQAGIGLPPLRALNGDVHIVRIIGTDASRPPEAVDEVRDDIVRDVRRLEHFERLAAASDDVAAQARTDGLLSLALDRDTVVQRPQSVSLCNLPTVMSQIRRGVLAAETPSSLPLIGVDRDAVAAIVDHAMSLDATGSDLSAVPETQRTFVVPLPDQLALMVVRLLDQTPLSEESFGLIAGSGALQLLLVGDELDQGQAIRDAFSYDAMAKRHEFSLLSGDADDDEGEGEGEDGEAEAVVDADA